MHFKLIWNPLSALIPLYSLQSVHLGSVVREAETSQWEKRIIDKWPMRVLDTCLLTGALREEKTLHKSRLTPGDECQVLFLTNQRPSLVTSDQWEARTVTQWDAPWHRLSWQGLTICQWLWLICNCWGLPLTSDQTRQHTITPQRVSIVFL